MKNRIIAIMLALVLLIVFPASVMAETTETQVEGTPGEPLQGMGEPPQGGPGGNPPEGFPEGMTPPDGMGEPPQGGLGGPGGNPFGGGFDFNGQSFNFDFGGAGFGGLDDILGAMFGGGFRGVRRGRDLRTSVTIDFKEAIFGTTKNVSIDGESIKLKIPAGIWDGQQIRLSGKGGPAPEGGQRGDLYVEVRVRAHKTLTREGDLILSEVTIPMVDAVLGTEVDVETVDGVVTMKIPAGTQPGTNFKLSGHGAPTLRNSERGPHIVTVNVEIPRNLSRKQKEIIEEFARTKRGICG